MGFPPTARLRSRIAPARSRSFRASGYERTGRRRKERNPSRPQQNQSPAQQNPSRGRQNPNPAQQNPNARSFRQPRLFNRLPPFQRSRAPLVLRRREAASKDAPVRAEPAQASQASFETRLRRSSILRDAPSTLLRMRRWLARRQSPPRRRSIRFLKSKPEFALLARKCRFFRRAPFCRRGARRQPALSSPGPDRLYSIAESFSVQTHFDVDGVTTLGADSCGFDGRPGRAGIRRTADGGNRCWAAIPLQARNRFRRPSATSPVGRQMDAATCLGRIQIGGRAMAFRRSHGWVALARHVEGNP